MQISNVVSNGKLVGPNRASGILARSIFKELKSNGYSRDQILALSGELIGLVTSDITDSSAGQVSLSA